MTMKEFDGIVKGVIAAAIIGLFTWVMTINADVKVNENEIKNNKAIAERQIEVTDKLADAINDLSVQIAKGKPSKSGG